MEIDVEGTVGVEVSQELRSSLGLDKTIVVDIEVVEGILNRHGISLLIVAHGLVGAQNLSGELLSIVEVKHHNTGKLTLNLDFSGIFLDDRLHRRSSLSSENLSGIFLLYPPAVSAPSM